jgi:hypothetical protein
MLPLDYMISSGLTLELTLAELGEAIICADATSSWRIDDVEFVAEVVTIDPAVDRAMRDMNPQGVSRKTCESIVELPRINNGFEYSDQRLRMALRHLSTPRNQPWRRVVMGAC